MVRPARPADLDAAAAIWLEGNLSAHDFIPPQYWQGNVELVKGLLAQAEVYVYEDEGEVLGFLGLEDGYIAGIFVRSEARSRGTGRQLLEAVKGLYSRLTLRVYQKNRRAADFYRREGFSVREESVDEGTGEAEYWMEWEA